MRNNSRILRWVILCVVLGFSATRLMAQNYRFSVPTLKMQGFVQPDASVQIVYDITFANAGAAHPIDIVDIGTPHAGYRLNNVTASVNGVRLTDVRKSAYVDPGFEVHLGSETIPAGAQGTLHLEFTMPDMVYQDTTDPKNASLRITPTWFGDKFVVGTTNIQLAVHLPAGVQPDEALYHSQAFSAKAIFGEDKHTVVSWNWPKDRLTAAHLVGVSFPKRGMTRVIRMSKFGLLVKWFKESPRVRLAAGLVYLVGLGFLFFRFTGGTGISVFVVLSGVLGFWFYNNPAAHLLAFLPLMALMALNEWFLQRRKRQYLPAIAEVEGGGIKRGLTAPEAAILLELPLGKVLTLVIFGLLKKRIVRQIQADPLIVEVKPPFRAQDAVTGDPKELAKFYRRVAKENKTIIRHYEHPFLFLLEANVAKPVAELNFSVPVKKLIERVARRMKGFDLSDTQDYYRSIVSRAMKQAKSIGEIPEREKTIDRNLEWLLLDDDYPTVFAHRGYYYRPMWTRGALGGSMPMPTGGVSAPAAPGGTTSFGDVAASFAGWSENTMGQMASAIQPGTLTFGEAHAGVLDLSGADRVTGDFFKSLAESGGGGGGGGGFSGGCACAGCACACACAGGGR